jgi:hypothetical protein
MHILVTNCATRCAVVIQGSATIYELKEKVAKQTNGTWPVEKQDLYLRGDPLADEMTLSEQGIADRDRIELRSVSSDAAAAAPSGGSGTATTAFDNVIAQIDHAAQELDVLRQQVERSEYVHQEYFTRLLEALDTLALETLTEQQRADVRPRRKAVVRQVEEVSASAGLLSARRA